MNILFMCVANSARSQLAEGLARHLARGLAPHLRIYSAGSDPAFVRPQAIEVMKEIGIDLGGHRSKGIHDVPFRKMDLVITLCAEEVCPDLPGGAKHLHWPIEDPHGHEHESDEEQLERFRVARDEINDRLLKLMASGL